MTKSPTQLHEGNQMATEPTTDIPEFPLFDVDDAELAFGADVSRYYGPRGWDAGKSVGRIADLLPAEARAFAGLFYNGGGLESHGFRCKPDLVSEKVSRALSALMRSRSVSHQQKEGTLALAIHRWCEPIPQEQAGEAA
jgi:hypothetical protein